MSEHKYTNAFDIVDWQEIRFVDIFDLAEIQHMQDLFADVHGVASLITDVEGNPITKPSNFTNFCAKIIRNTEIGCANCFKSDAMIGRYNPKSANVQQCLSGGLWDAGASITVGGKHIGNWLIGQVRNEDIDIEKLMQYANEIGADSDAYKAAFEKVPVMSAEKFTKVANLLFLIANELSEKAYSNLQLRNQIDKSELANKLLKESEERFQLLFNKAPLGYQSLDENGCFIEVNQKWLDTLGYEHKEVVGKWFGDFLSPQYQNRFRERFPIFKTQGYIHSEFEMLHKKGNTLFIAFDGKIGTDTEGNFKQTHCILQDITESKRTLDALKASEAKHRTILQTAMDGFWLVDLMGNLLEVNDAYCDMSGYSEAELLKMNIVDLDVFENEELTREHIHNVKTVGNDRFETKHRRKDGSEMDVEITVKILGTNLMVVFLRDITQQNIAKYALLEAEWKFKALFELGPIGVAYHRMIYDDAGVPIDYFFIDANASYKELTGVNPVGMTVRQAFPGIENDPADWIGIFGRVAKTGKTFRIEQFFVSNSRWYDCVAYQYKPDHFVAAFTEITQRKNAEALLEEQKLRLASIIEGTNVGTWEWNVQTGKTIFNERWVEIIGYNLEELMPISIETWEKFAHPDDLIIAIELLNKHFAGELDYYETETRMRHKNGEWVWVLDRGRVHTWTDDGKPLLMSGTHQDITERKISESKLIVSESKYRLLAENSTDVIWVLNITNNKYAYISPSIFQLRGITVDEAMDEVIDDSLTGESLIKIKDLIATDVARFLGNPNSPIDNTVEVQQPCKDGTIIWVEISTRLKYNEQNEIEVIGVSRNITERKINEQALRENEERFRATFEQAAVGIAQVAVDGKWLRVNQRLCEIVGYEHDELFSITFQDITHKDDLQKDLDNLEQLLVGSINSYNIEKRYIKKNGSHVWVNLTVGVVRDILNAAKYFVSVVEDITERKKAELMLENERSLYLDLVNTQPAGIYRIRVLPKASWENDAWRKSDNPPYKMELISDRFCEIFEISPELFERHPGIVIDLVHPDDKEEFVRKNNEANTMVSTFSLDCRLLINNNIKWVHFESIPRKLENGDILYTGIIYDITEQKIVHEKLQDSEMRFRKIIQDVESLSVQGYAPDGTIQYWNKASELMYGYTAEEAIGNNLVDLIVPADLRESTKRSIKQMAETGAFIPPSELSYLRKDGSFISVFSNHTIVQIAGQPMELFSIDIDLTERKNAEYALRESEEKLSALFNAMTETVVMNELVFDDNGEAIDYVIFDCNSAFEKLMQTPKENIVGKLASVLYNGFDPEIFNNYAKVGITGVTYEHSFYYRPLDIHFLVSVVSTGKNRFSTILTDITEIKKMYELIDQKNKELENYIYVASHDLRSPLVNIQGFSQRLQKQTHQFSQLLLQIEKQEQLSAVLSKATTEDIPKSLNFILNNVSKMDTLINGLLQVSRTGRVAINPTALNMNDLFKTILRVFDYQLNERKVKLIMHELDGCFGDANQLNQLFSNIISNAIKYSDKNRSLVIEIASEKKYNKVLYSIKDNGIGIAEKQMSKIWDIFYRANSTGDELGEGLGLSIAKQITEKHRGKIWAESVEGEGTTFFVELYRESFLENKE